MIGVTTTTSKNKQFQLMSFNYDHSLMFGFDMKDGCEDKIVSIYKNFYILSSFNEDLSIDVNRISIEKKPIKVYNKTTLNQCNVFRYGIDKFYNNLFNLIPHHIIDQHLKYLLQNGPYDFEERKDIFKRYDLDLGKCNDIAKDIFEGKV